MSRNPAEFEQSRPAAQPPEGAVSLAEMIADSGPLPTDAALECIQRLAERLAQTSRDTPCSLDAKHVLIDDDGDVWLNKEHAACTPHVSDVTPAPPANRSDDFQQMGRLLAYLVSGNSQYLDATSTPDTAELAGPVATITARLFSRNGAGYPSYAAVAADAAALYNVDSAEDGDGAFGTAEFVPTTESPASLDAIPEPAQRDEARESRSSTGFWLVLVIIGILALAVALAVYLKP